MCTNVLETPFKLCKGNYFIEPFSVFFCFSQMLRHSRSYVYWSISARPISLPPTWPPKMWGEDICRCYYEIVIQQWRDFESTHLFRLVFIYLCFISLRVNSLINSYCVASPIIFCTLVFNLFLSFWLIAL